MKRFSTVLAAVLCNLGAWAQCPSTVGAYDGTPEPGNPHTPFATNTGISNARGQRVQYIYPANELSAAGLCAGPISDIAFKALQTDVSDPGPDGIMNTSDDGPLRCDLLIDVRLGHTSLADFGPVVVSSATPLTVDWEPAVESGPNLFVNSILPRTVEAGWVEFPLTSNGFVWDGISNLVIDVAWLRNAVVGLSPAVELEEGMAYTATKWVQATMMNLSHGNTFEDNPLTANTLTGTTTTRPVTRFNNSSLSAPMAAPAASYHVRPDETGHGVIVSRGDAGREWSIDLFDAAGRLITSARMAAGTTTLHIPLSTGRSGVVLATATDASGARMMLGRAVILQ